MSAPMVNLVEFTHVLDLLDRISSPATVDRALRAAGLTRRSVGQSTGFLPYRLEAKVVEHVARALGDANLGARLARQVDYGVYDAYARYVLGSPDLSSALWRGKRAFPLIHPGSEIVLRKSDGHLLVGRRSGLNTMVGHRHLDDGAIFLIAHVIRHFLGPDWRPARIEATGDNPVSMNYLEATTGAPVRPRADLPAVAVRESDLAAPNPAPPDPSRLVGFMELPFLMGVEPPATMAETVLYVLRTQFVLGDLSEESVASRLAMGRRTLQRALKAEGTSFREVKMRFIEARARELLSGSDLDVSTIARTLGYCEPNSFRRAFRGWSGHTPDAFRAASADR